MVNTGATSPGINDIKMFLEYKEAFKLENKSVELVAGKKASGVSMKKGAADVHLRQQGLFSKNNVDKSVVPTIVSTEYCVRQFII